MVLAEVWLPSGEKLALDGVAPVSNDCRDLLETAALASTVEPTDPMEIALHNAYSVGVGTGAISGRPIHTFGLRPDMLAMSTIWISGEIGNASCRERVCQ